MVVGSVHLVETFEFFHTLRRNNWEGVWQLDQFPFREDSVRGRQGGDPLPQGASTARSTRSTSDALRGRAGRRTTRWPPSGWSRRCCCSSMVEEDACMTALSRRARHHAGRSAGCRPHASRAEQVAHIAEAARQIRIQDLKLVHYAGAGHIGGDFSAIDILATLYGAVLNVTPETVDDPERDRFILSKGHVAGALYTTLAAFGFLAGRGAGHVPQAAVAAERAPEPEQGAAASRPTPARSATACRSPSGTRSSAKLDVSRRRTYVLVGDGELQEGSNWEAMMAASQYELDRLTVIVDRNRLQQGATVRETNDLDPLDAEGGRVRLRRGRGQRP